MSWYNRYKSIVEGIKSTAQGVTNAAKAGYQSGSRKYTTGNGAYTYYESKANKYTYTGADNSNTANNVYVEGYNEKQLNRIIVYGAQKNMVLTQIEYYVKQEQNQPGFCTRDLKDACEYVHYA